MAFYSRKLVNIKRRELGVICKPCVQGVVPIPSFLFQITAEHGASDPLCPDSFLACPTFKRFVKPKFSHSRCTPENDVPFFSSRNEVHLDHGQTPDPTAVNRMCRESPLLEIKKLLIVNHWLPSREMICLATGMNPFSVGTGRFPRYFYRRLPYPITTGRATRMKRCKQ